MPVHDDILGAILERIDSQISLLRAASTCKRWRSIIAVPAFLRRFRSFHAPGVAGDYCNYYPMPSFPNGVVPETRHPVFLIISPSPSINAGHYYSLDFLPDNSDWKLVDSRGSLLLMRGSSKGAAIRDLLVVCEPSTRRYQRTPLPPELKDAARVGNFLQFYLIGDAGMSNFRVMCEHYKNHSMHVMVFSPGDGKDSSAWQQKDIRSVNPAGLRRTSSLGRATGSWYFGDLNRSNMLVVLDGRTGEFSTSMLPASENWEGKRRYNYCVTEGRDGKPRICFVVEGSMKVFAMRDEGEWALEKRLLLEEAIRGLPGYQPGFNRRLRILTMGPGFVILSLTPYEKWAVSVNLETMEVAPGVDYMGWMVYRCIDL
ncbi:hypothetical protein EJB05_00783, partial [Eragrostis curvula]